MTAILNRFQTRSRFFIFTTFFVGLLGSVSGVISIVGLFVLPPAEAPSVWAVANYVLTTLLGLAFIVVSIRNFRRLPPDQPRAR